MEREFAGGRRSSHRFPTVAIRGSLLQTKPSVHNCAKLTDAEYKSIDKTDAGTLYLEVKAVGFSIYPFGWMRILVDDLAASSARAASSSGKTSETNDLTGKPTLVRSPTALANGPQREV